MTARSAMCWGSGGLILGNSPSKNFINRDYIFTYCAQIFGAKSLISIFNSF
jgi:hypothetical protein